jgi:CxxC-x17-CxxC domain-containing protein
MDETYFSQDMNCMGYDKSELCFETIGCAGLFDCKSCDSCWNNSNIDFCNLCFSSKNLFGCIGLKHAQYCILNKQYSKEEYFKTREKIIQHMKKTKEWGEFFPIELSPFAYNETVADEYFPLIEKEILAKNLKFREEKQSFKYDGPKYEIPAKIEDVPDDIVDKILTCEATGKYYKIQKAELRFYRKMNLPIPRLCPDERHKRRMALRNPRKLFSRECAECGKNIQTTFAPDRPEKVLCEKCYLSEVN